MTDRFDYFVIFAEMRTGSNFLESNLNQFEELKSFGEAFNPNFIGFPTSTDILGISLEDRENTPLTLIDKLKEKSDVLRGFRFFHDHEPRILETILNDPRCAKIVLIRNPVESFVSWKIAKSTDQWKLTNAVKRKSAKITFDAASFEQFLANVQNFQLKIQKSLQITGQSAFYLNYDDLRDVDVLNGLARFLGVRSQIEKLSKNLKPQNPVSLAEKVSNPVDMETALRGYQRFDLGKTANFEPARPANIPGYIANNTARLLFMPVPGGPNEDVISWLTPSDPGPAALQSHFNRKTLRDWKNAHPKHKSFCVVSHPLERAHRVFWNFVLDKENDEFVNVRQKLMNRYMVPLVNRDNDLKPFQYKEAFLRFLKFLQSNLAGQTTVQVHPLWASQANIVAGFANFALPDFIIRSHETSQMLPQLQQHPLGIHTPFSISSDTREARLLSEIYDEELEDVCRKAYQKDYTVFGYGPLFAP